jgi:hypothetical protein
VHQIINIGSQGYILQTKKYRLLSTAVKIYAKPLLDEQFKSLSDFDVLLMHGFCLKKGVVFQNA